MKTHSAGYILIDGNKLEHIFKAEIALGRPLPKGAEVHHVNGIKTDNRNCNLVICNNREYHSLLHMRSKALNECGNANFKRCEYCKKWDDQKNLKTNTRPRAGRRYRHAECHRVAEKNRRERNHYSIEHEGVR